MKNGPRVVHMLGRERLPLTSCHFDFLDGSLLVFLCMENGELPLSKRAALTTANSPEQGQGLSQMGRDLLSKLSNPWQTFESRCH